MRDPDLVVRAQQAATALESAWRHWRNVHGLDADPMPPVSSYVGYSLDAPWGETRVVLGICAEEAELLASLLEGHDCVGPVYASVTAKPPAGRTQVAGLADALGQPGAAGLVHVPAPAPASAGQQARPAASSLLRHDPLSGPRRRDPAGPSELTAPSAGAPASLETPIALAASRAVEASIASRKNAANGSSANGSAANGSAANGSSVNGSSVNGSSVNGLSVNGSAVPRPGPAGEPTATFGHYGPRNGDRAGPGLRPALDLGREPPRPAESLSAGSADDATAAAVGDPPTTPAIRPFPWTASRLQGNADRRPAGEHDPAGGPAESLPAQRDEASAQHIESELARPSRVMRGPSWSALKRQGPNADRPQVPAADQSPAPQAAESAGWPQDSRDQLSSAAASADAATWAAGELPGQAAVTDTAL
jgi:hypothetical protein